MSDDKNRNLPVPASPNNRAPTVFTPQPASTGGIVDTWVTGWRAKQKAAAHRELAELNRAKADQIDAYGEMAESYMRTSKIVAQLDELPDEIAVEKAERQAERAAKYAALDAKYRRIERERDYDQLEHPHGLERDKLRRERELQQDRRALEDASRDLFNAKQGLEKQQRLAQVNSEIWEKRKQTEHMDAEKVRLLLSREIEGLNNPGKAGDGTLDQLREMRESLVRRAVELAADGDASQAEKYEGLVNELDELLIEAVRGRRQE